MKNKTRLLWVLALVLTIAIAFFQRATGPTYPIKNSEQFAGHMIAYRFARSHITGKLLPIQIKTNQDAALHATVSYRRYRTADPWTELDMLCDGKGIYTAQLPGQPAAGKLEYAVTVTSGAQMLILNKGHAIIARFRGDVPAWIMIPHILLMFASILLAMMAFFLAMRKDSGYQKFTLWTMVVMILGGLIMGPIVQKIAFGQFWTGWPFGYDLTDNKALLVIIFWLLACIFRKNNHWLTILAAVLMVAIYLIPHSVLGSELDYNSGKLRNTTGYFRQLQPATNSLSPSAWL